MLFPITIIVARPDKQMESNLADTIVKAWLESLIKQRDALSKSQAFQLDESQSSQAAHIVQMIKSVDDVLMKIYMLAKSEKEIPDSVLADIHKEIFGQKD